MDDQCYLVEFPLASGGHVLVEVRDHGGLRREERAGGVSDIVSRSINSFEEVMAKIDPVVGVVVTAISNSTRRPDEFTFEFGFSVRADSGIVIAAAGTEATFKATLKWKNEGVPNGDGENVASKD